MGFFKDFTLNWFGKKKLQELTDKVEELRQIVLAERVSTKPYKNAYYSQGILTIVLHDGDIISKVCSVDQAKLLNNLPTEAAIRDVFGEKAPIPEVKPVQGISEQEQKAKQKFTEHSDEVLDILGDLFETDGVDFFYKGIPLAIPTILVNSLLETKRQGEEEQFESLKNFWLWTSTNPVESSREDLFTFIRNNDVKLTPKGLLVLYRRIVALDKNRIDKSLEDFVSKQYFLVKKNKKSPKNYDVYLVDGEYKKVSTDVDSDGQLVGNLSDLYQNLSRIAENLYTDNHTKTMQIRIGDIYKIDEEKVDLDNSIDCSRGLHVASKSYNYGSFGDVPVLCLVNPAKVRAVPTYSTGKMRVSEMFIASVLKNGPNGEYIDDGLDVVPFDEEYCNITIEELEEASRSGLHLLAAKKSEVAVDVQAVKVVIDDIKAQIKNRVVTLD
jgi:hypothetical protein